MNKLKTLELLYLRNLEEERKLREQVAKAKGKADVIKPS